ncbi:MAG: hypothetical protein ACJ8KX_07155 [Chthoniobacterales bacterium]|jgi:hypothetical protein
MLRATFTFLILLLGIASPRAQNGADDKELPGFLRAAKMQNVRWRTFETKDLSVYYCMAEHPRTGAAALELGRKPFVIAVKETDIAVDGSFGRFPVKWFRRTISDGSRQAETTFRSAPQQWAHVMVEARDEVGILQFIGDLGRLALFAPVTEEKSYAGPGLVDPKLRSRPSTEPQPSPATSVAAAAN